MLRFCLIALLFLANAAPAQQIKDSDALRTAFFDASRNDWVTARRIAAEHSPLLADIVDWRMLREAGGRLTEFNAFVAKHPDWPDQRRQRLKVERYLADELDLAAILQFFRDYPAQTGAGVLAHARALEATGRPTEAETLVVKTWQTFALNAEEFAAFRVLYEPLIAPHNETRLDMLLWRGRFTDASRLLERVSPEARALAEARIALRRETGDVDAKIEAVPEAQRTTAGLGYERFRWRLAKGQTDAARDLLAGYTISADLLGKPARWAGQRRNFARELMRDGKPETAYFIAATHHLTSGSAFADLEFLAGFIALRKLEDPERALRHFERLEAAVKSPISLGRAGYWLGRTHEALGDFDAATRAHTRASQHQTSFYGLLSAEWLGVPLDPALAGTEDFGDWRQGAFLTNPMVQAADVLLRAGQLSLAEVFMVHIVDTLDRQAIGQLADYVIERGEPHLAVMIGKRAASRGIVLPKAYYPLHPLAQTNLPVPPELALAIARRESEFDPAVRSSVGARGLMQLMPATAKAVSADLGLPYTVDRLTSDPKYNAVLGSSYLAELTEIFGPSYVMVAAAYNAGPSRPLRWMTTFGDPRKGQIDVVDWIEMIPFSETRNYVMRVMESLPVYRARLSGKTGPLNFTKELIGRAPVIRPRARPDNLGQPKPPLNALPEGTAGSAD
ncbi:transglycosylase SLT domain-containing protein [Algirhabdus cladophorae]|uniref:lytic transglycosylase domain-containing protein n=1 Tax=Algirhabdus cladophorae TaxID=3377108 RepID=UPI003B848C68